ncbi:bursicon-like isoform X1 [Anoplolepis gracilipes]|uniref:bursicon-like isoform X1 n=1 Tax=Anoplolepis gracilipes TaxID=354296 RepID=UPI003B9E5F97
MYRSRSKLFHYLAINGLVMCLLYGSAETIVGVDECQATRVIHFLQYPGCVPKPIPSYACRGRCSSYLQVSGSKMWQMERSCMCCQESGEREASVSLFCPRAKPGEKKFRKVRRSRPPVPFAIPATGTSGVRVHVTVRNKVRKRTNVALATPRPTVRSGQQPEVSSEAFRHGRESSLARPYCFRIVTDPADQSAIRTRTASVAPNSKRDRAYFQNFS